LKHVLLNLNVTLEPPNLLM